MFEVGEYVVYGSTGICRVEEITRPDIPGCDPGRLYYVLSPVNKNSAGRSFIPVDNVKVVLRKVIEKKDALKLIDNIPEVEEIWINNDKLREKQYKDMSKLCDCRQWISIIKTIYIRKQERSAAGKKLTATDEKYLRLAEDNLYGELGFALNKDKDEMEAYITERINSRKDI
ncbi:MAG: CarD family transcriptional regulator [Butyrivibrio sp.]